MTAENLQTTPSPQTPPFLVPVDGPTFIEQVRSRCHDLIQCGIWSGLHIQKLNQWWSNFTTESERYFAACLLDSVIYRSDEQTIALMRQLIQRVLPDHGRTTGGITDWEDRLRKPGLFDPGIRLVPVIPCGSAQGKSAHVILRQFEKRLGVPSRLMARAEDISSLVATGVDTFLFVDDLLGTGNQFVDDFARPHGLGVAPKTIRFIYAPLVAHVDGINHIAQSLPNISVAAAELLGPQHAIFGADSRSFNDGTNTSKAAWNVYANILASRGITLNASQLRGYGALELAFFFEHAAPDNSLPIFWWKDCPHWKPLFYR
jgi:hypothetical protein